MMYEYIASLLDGVTWIGVQMAVNARVVLVGASDTSLSALETLVHWCALSPMHICSPICMRTSIIAVTISMK